jgi:hypothetical protein
MVAWDLLLREHGGGQLHAFAAVPDSGTQEQSTQMLLHGARTDVELIGNFLVAATLNQEFENLFVAGG